MKDSNSPPFILVDGSSYLFRAYHALPPLTNSAGHPTGAIKGVIGMLKKLLQSYHPTHMAVVFDAKGKNFRHDLYPDYKSNRPEMPEELACQIDPIHQMIQAMGIPLVIKAQVEADDVIGTLAKQAQAQGWQVLISTGDKDMIQLVNDQIQLIDTMKNQLIDLGFIKEKYGFLPECFVDYLALMGDKVDNIPGLPGVGEKTAKALLTEVGNVETIYQQLDALQLLKVRGSKTLKEKFITHQAQLELSFQLATIRCDIQLEDTIEQLQVHPEQPETLLALYKTYEFKAWQEALQVATPSSSHEGSEQSVEAIEAAPGYETVLTDSAWKLWLNKLKQHKLFVLDTETTGLDYQTAQIVGISLAVESFQSAKIEACYVPLLHDYLDVPKQLKKSRILSELKPLLEDSTYLKIGQNLKYDQHVLANEGIHLSKGCDDTMLQSYVLSATASRHDMDSLALKYLGKTTIKFEEVAGKGAKQKTFNQIEIASAAQYAAEDAEITYALYKHFSEKLAKSTSLQKLYDVLEKPLMPILNKMERHGALIDAGVLAKQSEVLAESLISLKEKITELAGEAFNIDSPKQLGVVLYEKLQLPVLKKTPKGAPSTAEAVLQELALDYPLPALVLEYRSASKLRSTYTEKLPQLISQTTGRLHTSYHQAVTATGRLSSSDPNLQNIPIKTKQGRKIRQAFIAPANSQLVAFDYSQVELRIMAHLSQDKRLLEAFKLNQDIHTATAAEILSKSIDEVTHEERRRAKAVNFGLLYGMSAFGLAKQLKIERSEAQTYINCYFARYPEVAQYMESVKASAREKGYVETLMGRRLYLPDINASNKMRQQAAERTAINAPMQGTAADIIKQAMIDVDAWLTQTGKLTRMIMQVHDELVFEVPKAELEAVISHVRTLMEKCVSLSVPLIVEAGVGNNWDEAH